MIKSEAREYTTNTGVLETVKKPEPNTIKAINATGNNDSQQKNNKHDQYKKQQKPNTIQAINSTDSKDKSTDNNENKSEEKK